MILAAPDNAGFAEWEMMRYVRAEYFANGRTIPASRIVM
jgi:hypothetical protein